MTITLNCNNCNKKIKVLLQRGVKPTADVYAGVAQMIGFTKQKKGYLCKDCFVQKFILK